MDIWGEPISLRGDAGITVGPIICIQTQKNPPERVSIRMEGISFYYPMKSMSCWYSTPVTDSFQISTASWISQSSISS